MRCERRLISTWFVYFNLPVADIGVNILEDRSFSQGVEKFVHTMYGIEPSSGYRAEYEETKQRRNLPFFLCAKTIGAAHTI